ncbi:uncharacterized protein LOC135848508 isoform X2 [Planococcus citri]|uniref:uncharacterized protein LOC135848508 isoform X2 n=1 Tax=Planococcus citri TaxID=170843 RepID=UPI0031F8FDC7
MIKSSLFICAIFILVQNGNSSPPDEFGSFWGPCPASPIDTTSSSSFYQISGKWYTHYVLGQYSPWKVFECQTNEIIHKRKEDTANVTSRFVIPESQIPVELEGIVLEIDPKIGKFDFEFMAGKYTSNWFWTQYTQILQTSRKGAALAWTCLDFGDFHIESIALMTKYQDAHDSRIPPDVYRSLYDSLVKVGISPTWFEQIAQKSCDNYNFSSSKGSSVQYASKNLQSVLPAKFLKQLKSISEN